MLAGSGCASPACALSLAPVPRGGQHPGLGGSRHPAPHGCSLLASLTARLRFPPRQVPPPSASSHREPQTTEMPLEGARCPDAGMMPEELGQRGRASSCPPSWDALPPAPSVLSPRGPLSWDGSSIAASPGLEGAELGEAGNDGCTGGITLGDAAGGERLATTSQILAPPTPWVLQRGENWRESSERQPAPAPRGGG